MMQEVRISFRYFEHWIYFFYKITSNAPFLWLALPSSFAALAFTSTPVSNDYVNMLGGNRLRKG